MLVLDWDRAFVFIAAEVSVLYCTYSQVNLALYPKIINGTTKLQLIKRQGKRIY